MSMPILVSYPRSGAHWIQAMMEIYFDRPRGPRQNGGITWRPQQDDEPFMWIHTHDADSSFPVGAKCLFLLRNPIYCIFSYLSVGGSFTEEEVEKKCDDFLRLFTKWVVNGHIDDIVKFEQFTRDPVGAFTIVSNHHNETFNEARMWLALETCTKEAVIAKGMMQRAPLAKFHSSVLLTKEYHEARKTFSDQWADFISKLLVNCDTELLLGEYFV